MTSLPLDFPPLLVEAERLALVFYRLFLSGVGILEADEYEWEPDDVHIRRGMTLAHIDLLADLTRPESRDLWVRWGIAHETTEAIRTGDRVAIGRIRDAIPLRWMRMRDDPAALVRAVLAVPR